MEIEKNHEVDLKKKQLKKYTVEEEVKGGGVYQRAREYRKLWLSNAVSFRRVPLHVSPHKFHTFEFYM